MTAFEKARAFIYRNARPLDLARWRYHFEDGPAQDVLAALAFYQNADGGFGHALEPDFWNPNSSPIATWNAACILLDVDAPSGHPLVQGVLRYLASGADFDETHQQWLNVVPTNNDYPHAAWWSYDDAGSEFQYNPTAMLAGFALRYAEAGSPLHEKARRISGEAIAWYMTGEAMGEQHVLSCFLSLRECLRRLGEAIPPAFDAMLHERVRETVCTDPDTWRTQYVCRPSNLTSSKDSPFCQDLADAIPAECTFLQETQSDDGSWPVSWTWWPYTPEFEVAANWWKSQIIIERMRFLHAFLPA